MSIKVDTKLLTNPHVEVTDNLNITYYVTEEGTPITLGGRKTPHGWERCFEHVELFSTFRVRAYNWTRFFKVTKLLQVIPEPKWCCFPKDLELSEAQKKFIEDNNLTLIRD